MFQIYFRTERKTFGLLEINFGRVVKTAFHVYERALSGKTLNFKVI